jgi:hypothetical protein
LPLPTDQFIYRLEEGEEEDNDEDDDPINRNSCVAMNGAIHSTECVVMQPHLLFTCQTSTALTE